ncbi:hypothetical protein QOZ80_5BG0433200 [Eleusine coracana subsp. coracana]|nr:hypothetical protein QOZ80_5BG0433200 [Eleusine coracana subsp. coracana]
MSSITNAKLTPPLHPGSQLHPDGKGRGSTMQPSPSLPLDILRVVMARCNHETLVRCAASSRLLCRCMLEDPSFLRHADMRGFAPSLFLGLFNSPQRNGTCFIEAPEPAIIPRDPIGAFLLDNARLLNSFNEPGTCSDGLVVLQRGRRMLGKTIELCVCNPLTRHHCFLPAPEVYDQSLALLVGENASKTSPFQMLAVDLSLTAPHAIFQIFSSLQPFPVIAPGSAWGPVHRVAIPRVNLLSLEPMDTPVVINRVAHWLSRSSFAAYVVLTLHIDAGYTKQIKGPRSWVCSDNKPRSVVLASTADRRLSLVKLENYLVSMWVLSKYNPNIWERIVAVDVRPVILASPYWIRLDWVGGKSGTVIMCMAGPGRVVLNLETKEVAPMPDAEWPGYLYEMDLPSLIKALASTSA